MKGHAELQRVIIDGLFELQAVKENPDVLALIQSAESDHPSLPFQFLQRSQSLLLEMSKRLTPDMQRGIMLEAVQHMVAEVYEKFVDVPERTGDSLLVALANLTFIRTQLLSDDTTEGDGDEDQSKTEGTIWKSLRGSYHSVLQFFGSSEVVDENMPLVRREQHAALIVKVDQLVDHVQLLTV